MVRARRLLFLVALAVGCKRVPENAPGVTPFNGERPTPSYNEGSDGGAFDPRTFRGCVSAWTSLVTHPIQNRASEQIPYVNVCSTDPEQHLVQLRLRGCVPHQDAEEPTRNGRRVEATDRRVAEVRRAEQLS